MVAITALGQVAHGELAVLRYFYNMNKVEGWLSDTTAHFIRNLLMWQSENKISGDLVEIGLHHGRLFLVLCLSSLKNEACIGIDLFDMQHLNVDRSGAGNQTKLNENLEIYAPNANVELITGDSVALANELKTKLRNVRFMSIDGGHTRATTLSDLFVAEAVVCEGAVVSLDDIYRVEWSGVTAGLARYLRDGGRLVPFAVTPNKVHLTTSLDWASQYKNIATDLFSVGAPAEFFDFEVALIPESTQWSRDEWITSVFPEFGEVLSRNIELKNIADQLWNEKTALWNKLKEK